mgnify:FL=1
MLKIIFFFILALRIILFNLQSFHIDMSTWEAWSYRLVSLGPSNFYSYNYFSDYFPGYLYILWIAGGFYHLVFPNLSFADLKFELMIKFITLGFDIATSYYIYKIVNKYSKKLSKLSALLYMSNPAVIFNSSIWGQIDGIFTFFIVYSSHLLIEVKKPLKASFFSSIAFLIKPQSIALYPLIALEIFKSFRKNLLSSLLIILITPIIFSLPFFISNPIFGLINLFQNSTGVYPHISLFAFNFWGIFGWWKPDKDIFLFFSYQAWGIILYILSMIIVLYPAWKNKLKPSQFYLACALSSMVFFIFLTRIHERYLFPFLAFILIASFVNKSKILTGFYFLISLTHFVNLWYVYYFYNFVYNNIKPDNNLLFKFVSDNHIIFSLILIISFFSITFFYYRLFYEKLNK